jgi:hypothetical protein
VKPMLHIHEKLHSHPTTMIASEPSLVGSPLRRTQGSALDHPAHWGLSAAKRVPSTTGGSLRSSGGRGYARLFLKLKKIEGNRPQTAQK